jgi:hypothetical protein
VNGRVVGHANGHANAHVNGHANAHANGWRFRVRSGRIGAGESADVVIVASPKGEGNAQGKVTIGHTTGSWRTPFVPITISVNGLNGHAEHSGDVVVAGGSITKTNGNGAGGNAGSSPSSGQSETTPAGNTPAGTASPTNQLVAGTQFAGNGANAGTTPASGTTTSGTAQSPASAVLGVGSPAAGTGGSNSEAGTGAVATAPSSANASRRGGGSLPFTGVDLVWVLMAAAGSLTAGLALRRAASSKS